MSNQREQVNQIDQSFSAYVKRQFKKNKRALYSLYLVIFLGLVAIFADFIANDKPLICKYKGSTMMPIFKSYAVSAGLANWPEDLQNISWNELDYDWAIFPPVPYLPTNQDMINGHYIGPTGDQKWDKRKWLNSKRDETAVGPQKLPTRYWHWLGTDQLGRDVLSGMIHATRIAFLVGFISMGLASIIGIFVGALAGYFGDERLKISRGRMFMNILGLFFAFFYGFSQRSYILGDALEVSIGSFLTQVLVCFVIFFLVLALFNLIAYALKLVPWFKDKIAVPMDMIVSRVIEVMVSVPILFLLITVVALVPPHIFWVMLVIGLVSWTGMARLIRAELLKVRSLEYIEAAHAMGFSEWRTMFKHAIPNALSPVFIAIAFGVAGAILTEATLSFLGIGVSADTITWGKLLNMSRQHPLAWWLAIFPGFAIFILVTAFNLIGEGLSDALDPRLKN